ncbi:MAG: tetratricopeptide repeat protein [Bacteroidales bacterium]|nr:tetratricopeptide repeat protein [Bacteroidales bacterium]
MMKEKALKYFFYISSVFLLIIMLFLSRNAGISCDEVLHYQQSVAVYNYFASHGQDQSALNTPESHLKYYGQSYDNIVTGITKSLDIKNVYGFRHLMSSLAGWLTIFIAALFAIWLSGYRTAILVLLLFAVSPTYMGHAQNNLKDVPFALGYILSVFFTIKILSGRDKLSFTDILILIAGIALAISIRAGGLILICYLLFFYLVFIITDFLREKRIDLAGNCRMLVIIALTGCSAWILSILLWPYALQSPLKNVLVSYNVMAHFPSTFRQIFEGNMEWSDFMPWYYLVKSMGITFPLLVLVGIAIFMVFSKQIYKSGKAIIYGLLVFTILFPVLFVILIKSNIYSSWRQFLFIYPGIIILAAAGFNYLFDFIKKGTYRMIVVTVFLVLSIHPVSFMIRNRSYYYLYYNQLVGGLKGAYGNYETDYYYLSQTEASEWLTGYLERKKVEIPLKVAATFSVQWQFREHPEIETSYIRFEERSQADWDYAITVNRYISPFKLKNNRWPPDNAIHVVYADQIPICAVLERKTKADYIGYQALQAGKPDEAINHFQTALEEGDEDEMIFYNFARALYSTGHHEKADSVLRKGLEMNPESEPVLMYLGNIAKAQKRSDDAAGYYRRLIGVNRKYFEAYVELSELVATRDLQQARKLLRTCLTMNPEYGPAIAALAETYRAADPDIAKKYDELLEKIENKSVVK